MNLLNEQPGYSPGKRPRALQRQSATGAKIPRLRARIVNHGYPQPISNAMNHEYLHERVGGQSRSRDHWIPPPRAK